MARLLRVEYEGAIYHVTIRGNERQVIFRDEADRERFLERLEEGVEEYGIRLYLFVMMKNHVHLVFETPGGNLSRFMHNIETGYTVYYNLRHDRTGHLMQGRFGAKVVEGDEYLLKLSRYVHLNPVFVGSIKRLPLKEKIAYLRRYRWSSYPSYIGKRKRHGFVEYGPMLSLMEVKKTQQGKEYCRFVEAGLVEKDEDMEETLKESRLSIGSEGFRRWIWDMHLEKIEGERAKEDVSFRRMSRKIAVEKILQEVALELGVEEKALYRRRREGYERGIAAKMLCKHGGLTQREVAALLQVGTGAAVSQQLKRLEGLLSNDRRLRRKVERIEGNLRQKE